MKDLWDLLSVAADKSIDVFFILAGLLLIVLYIVDKVYVWLVLPYDRRRLALGTGIAFLVVGILIAGFGNRDHSASADAAPSPTSPALASVLETPVQAATLSNSTPDPTATPTSTTVPTSLPASPTPETVFPTSAPSRTSQPPAVIPNTGDPETDLLARNILLSGDPRDLAERRGWLGDPAYQALIKNTLDTLGDRRLINAIHLDTLNGIFVENIDPTATSLSPEKYNDPEQIRLAIKETWERNYPGVENFEDMLMPLGLQQSEGNIPPGGLLGADLLSSTVQLAAKDGDDQEYVEFNRYLLQGKNWLAVTLDLNGFYLMGGDDAKALIIDQPPGGDWHYANLSDYVINGQDGEQTIYIPLDALNLGGGTLDLSAPVGTLHFRIWTDKTPFEVDITRVVAYYSAP